MARILRLVEIARAKDRIAATCAIDDLTFTFSIWYQDVDFDALRRAHGELVDRIVFHIAMFQINAVASLRPEAIELGRYAKYASPAFVELWRTVFEKVWAQWRWEHQLPAYVPAFVDAAGTSAPPGRVPAGPVELLAFCGGGKDSLVALKLLERAGLPFATLGYAHSIYGASAPQHALLDRVGERTARVRAERQWIIDDFLDAPVVQLRPELGVRTITAAETPASVFAALPIALARGYRHLVLAHEASANSGNLTWSTTGEEVNHQWGKSWEAERLLDAYVQKELLDVGYWSVLQPIHDEVIFELLARDGELAPLTHSCNVAKPWCGTCAKCAYVWLQMAAHLPPATVAATFGGRDLGELPQNERWFRELLGLAEHSPFECVGSPAEAKLALALLPARGPQLARFAAECGPLDIHALAKPFLGASDHHAMPAHVAERVMPLLRDAAQTAAARIAAAK
ncbi:MAG: hypothetical protein ABJE66_00870 [Deltaproteobacteria bacterium]